MKLKPNGSRSITLINNQGCELNFDVDYYYSETGGIEVIKIVKTWFDERTNTLNDNMQFDFQEKDYTDIWDRYLRIYWGGYYDTITDLIRETF